MLSVILPFVADDVAVTADIKAAEVVASAPAILHFSATVIRCTTQRPCYAG